MSSFLHIITYYYTLLHNAAFANTMCELVLTGPRASTPDILDTPNDDVLEPYPQSPPETDVHKRQKSQAAVTSLHPGLPRAGSCFGQAISANNTDDSKNN